MSDLPFEMDDDEKTPPEPATLASNVVMPERSPATTLARPMPRVL